MDTQVDWREELDSSFGEGRDVVPAHYLEAGHRVARRRRAALAVAGVAAAVVVAGATWSLAPGSAPRGGEAPVASDPARPTRTADGRGPEDRVRSLAELRRAGAAEPDFLGNPAVLVDGGLVLADGAGPVLQRVPNPMGYTPAQGTSLGIRVWFEGREQYSLMTSHVEGTSTSTATVDATGDFPGWLDQAVRTQRTLDVANGVTPAAGSDDGPWLELGADGSVEAARAGVLIEEVRSGVDLGPSFADGADGTGAVRLRVDGSTEHAAFRVVDGVLDVVPGGGRFASMDAFLAWARAQYASGSGMR
ncbi:hypothetical protein [Nocardioides zeicaulis]|uniref:Uncharacterized protein n=1 Tax=Nocardioides zeicaulis TaxID=1776857 RepID=A0ABV6E057_9ACTN